MIAPSPYLTAAEAAAYLKFPNVRAFYKFRARHELKTYRRGGTLLFKQADLDHVLDVDAPTHRLARPSLVRRPV
jgi:hypothetical protein